jgi:hypothetical protein
VTPNTTSGEPNTDGDADTGADADAADDPAGDDTEEDAPGTPESSFGEKAGCMGFFPLLHPTQPPRFNAAMTCQSDAFYVPSAKAEDPRG